jgi:hypothetical protein
VVVGPLPAIVSAEGWRLQGNQLIALEFFMLDVQPVSPIDIAARLAAKARIQGAILNRMVNALHCVLRGNGHVPFGARINRELPGPCTRKVLISSFGLSDPRSSINRYRLPIRNGFAGTRRPPVLRPSDRRRLTEPLSTETLPDCRAKKK